MNRQEHLNWCKERALQYLEHNDVPNAITSMLSDLDKHPETKPGGVLTLLGMHTAMSRDVDEARRFIEGFN